MNPWPTLRKWTLSGTLATEKGYQMQGTITIPFTEQDRVTCSLKRLAKLTGIPYEQLLAASKLPTSDPRRPPGFRAGTKFYVLVDKAPEWLGELTEL